MNLPLSGVKLSYRREKIVLGDNFSDLLSKFFHSPKRDFPSPILRRFSSYDLTYRKGSCDVFLL